MVFLTAFAINVMTAPEHHGLKRSLGQVANVVELNLELISQNPFIQLNSIYISLFLLSLFRFIKFKITSALKKFSLPKSAAVRRESELQKITIELSDSTGVTSLLMDLEKFSECPGIQLRRGAWVEKREICFNRPSPRRPTRDVETVDDLESTAGPTGGLWALSPAPRPPANRRKSREAGQGWRRSGRRRPRRF
ncbi:hypothetical protein EVAR_21095_1 [Eumeta japonica]|uniref:Uncharacterized protein n=1 Tax=Eumeta variegata TaxID=151549 RepID=A0A4C1V004_EUMVA|nr:hypothetical protein EVAR_21095_1 [Eumeta japonica]